MAVATLCTIGYSGFTPETFADKLAENDVEVLIDVRQRPLSRKKGFSKRGLQQFLEARGIQYLHIQTLGVPNPLRDQLRNGWDLGEYLCSFKQYLSGCDEILQDVYDQALQKRCCLMCVEKNERECHRSVVADAVFSRNGHQLRIEHL